MQGRLRVETRRPFQALNRGKLGAPLPHGNLGALHRQPVRSKEVRPLRLVPEALDSNLEIDSGKSSDNTGNRLHGGSEYILTLNLPLSIRETGAEAHKLRNRSAPLGAGRLQDNQSALPFRRPSAV